MIMHIDFEVALEGIYAAELDLAQVLYSIFELTPKFEEAIAVV